LSAVYKAAATMWQERFGLQIPLRVRRLREFASTELNNLPNAQHGPADEAQFRW
jgi:hypothetical protein